jgi:hypothetical protein
MDNLQVELEEIFLLGYWGNPYRSGDNEYFWMQYFDTRKEALDAGKSKQKYGQPEQFWDWVQGKNRVFTSRSKFLAAAKKVGLNPKLD